MLKNELKAALAIMGTLLVPMFAQADQSMSMSQGKQSAAQQPGYTSGDAVKAGQLPGGYNQSATYMCDNGWDVYLTGDYIWWNWSQDKGMRLGSETRHNVAALTNVDLTPTYVDPGYASGFQVGLGFNMKGMDDWNFYGEYTWYKNSGNKSVSVDASVTEPSVALDASAHKHVSIKYSNADFLLQRPFYFGKKLTSNFYTGLKALWITNEFSTTGSGTGNALEIVEATVSSFSANGKLSSWALGPKFGLDSNWLLGYGFKMLSNVSVSALYTRYTKSMTATSAGEALLFPGVLDEEVNLASNVHTGFSNYGTLRPVLETFLGLGWGSYFCDESFRFDLTIGYDFNIHWNYIGGGGLYLHGLNVQARFDF